MDYTDTGLCHLSQIRKPNHKTTNERNKKQATKSKLELTNKEQKHKILSEGMSNNH